MCWIVALKRLGCVDPEHGDVVTFPDVTWTELAANPLPYLDAQWGGNEIGVRVLPWLHFPFKFSEVDAVLRPYGSRCPVHDTDVVVQRTRKPALFDVMRRREPEDWLQNYLTTFPYSGLPMSDGELLCCPDAGRRRMPGYGTWKMQLSQQTSCPMLMVGCNVHVVECGFCLLI